MTETEWEACEDARLLLRALGLRDEKERPGLFGKLFRKQVPAPLVSKRKLFLFMSAAVMVRAKSCTGDNQDHQDQGMRLRRLSNALARQADGEGSAHESALAYHAVALEKDNTTWFERLLGPVDTEWYQEPPVFELYTDVFAHVEFDLYHAPAPS
jgi:hypothetical protein